MPALNLLLALALVPLSLLVLGGEVLGAVVAQVPVHRRSVLEGAAGLVTGAGMLVAYL